MMKSILIGNGINIAYGGAEYSNASIMQRVQNNIASGRYDKLFPKVSKSELKGILMDCSISSIILSIKLMWIA